MEQLALLPKNLQRYEFLEQSPLITDNEKLSIELEQHFGINKTFEEAYKMFDLKVINASLHGKIQYC